MDDRVTEFVDHLHEHFVDPVVIRKARYMRQSLVIPLRFAQASRLHYRFPDGLAWKENASR